MEKCISCVNVEILHSSNYADLSEKSRNLSAACSLALTIWSTTGSACASTALAGFSNYLVQPTDKIYIEWHNRRDGFRIFHPTQRIAYFPYGIPSILLNCWDDFTHASFDDFSTNLQWFRFGNSVSPQFHKTLHHLWWILPHFCNRSGYFKKEKYKQLQKNCNNI